MPTENKKKKSKKDEKKDEKKMSSFLIKSEPIELKSLDHYVDDRVELIRQIFDSLKAKTVESIIPEFLQEKPIEEIQELCLEEVLGISKKRLLSIINATKCPTDTESSDSGSDVEKIEEHISLEEISSDSNDELSKPKKKKKREQNKDPLPNKTVVPAKPAEQNGENVEKQYSVLELLELQARARAIRSQLALEPVTKIELDDSDAESSPPSKEKEVDQNAETASVPVQKDNSQKTKDQPKHTQDQTKMPATRPVRLKRNFRQRQTEGYESDENQMAGENEKEKTNADETQSVEPEKQKSPMKDADNASAVANDDDVVPIIAEPEVLCISSSDSESDDKSTSSKVKKYINMPVVEKIDRPPTEDELFLLKIKEKSEAKLKSDIVVNKDGKTTERATDDVQIVEKETKDNPNEEQETEDGEIIEEDEIVEIAESPERPQVEEKLEENKTVTAKGTIDTEMNESILKESEKEVDKSQDIHDSNSSASESEDDKKSSDSEDSSSDSESSEIKSRSLESRNSKKSNADDDDDDIIDLGKDEDLDFEQLEMSTAREEPKKVESPRRNTRSKTKSRKSDEREKSTEPKDESWDKRWLRGNKVSKVLQVSKLANKVRSKRIENKSKTVTKTQIPEPEATKEPETVVPTNVELGSVEHYKELTKQK